MFKKPLIKILLTTATSAIFVAGAVLFCVSAAGESNILSVSVAVNDSVLDGSDIKTSTRWDDSCQAYVQYNFYDVYDYNNIQLTVNYANGSCEVFGGTEISRLSAEISEPFVISDTQSQNEWTTGSHTVTYSLGEFTATAQYTVQENAVSSFTVTPMYEITPVFEVDGDWRTYAAENGSIYERFEYDFHKYDYDIVLTLADGSTVSCTNHSLYDKTGFEIEFVQPEGLLQTGKYTALCIIGGATADFDFEITENIVQSVELYMSDGADMLTLSDGFYDTDINGEKYYRFLYDRTKIHATVTYTDGTVTDYHLGALCDALDSRLELEDNQKKYAWQSGEITLDGKIKGIGCQLTLSVPLGTVGAVSVGNTAYHEAELFWDSVPCDGYEIRQYVNGEWILTDDIAFGENSCNISGLLSDTQYVFAVCAYNSEGGQNRTYSRQSTVQFATKQWKTGGATATATDDSVTLSWDKDSYADGYIICRYTEGKWERVTKITDNSVVSFTATGFGASQKHRFYVRAYKMSGAKALYSDSAFVTAYTNPSKVSGFAVGANGLQKLTLSWNTSECADGYIICRYDGESWNRIAKITDNKTGTYTDTGLAPQTKYRYYIRAYKMQSGKAYYSPIAYVSGTTALTGVTEFYSDSAYSRSVTMKWNTVQECDGYIICRYDGQSWNRIVKLTDNKIGTYTDSNLSPQVEYRYYIRTYKMLGGKAYYGKPKYLTVKTK